MTGEVDEGAEQLREAIRIARERDDLPDLSDAYVNYSDMLHILGRSDEARAIALEGREAVGERRPIAIMWLDCQLAEFAYDVGDWESSEQSLPDAQRWTGVHTRVNLNLRKAHLLVGRGRHDAAQEVMTELAELAADSSEPQFVGPVATLTAELRRREGDLDAARAAIDRGLDQMEFCTDDAARVSAVAAAGVTVEADAAERARDLGDRTPRPPRCAASTTCSRASPRPPCARARSSARCCSARAPRRAAPAAAPTRRRSPAPPRHGRTSLGRSGRRSCAGARPRPTSRAATARPPRRPRAPPTRSRSGSAPAGCAARSRASRPARGWTSRASRTATSPSSREEDDDGFGLTSRERQVLALVAEGATNREIGAQLFMAEKTASVHVSRILSKLNVRSRTEAAAVAHRNRLS